MHPNILPPLILTVQMDPDELNFFDGLRQQHFPAERNFLTAHLTLFHALPNTIEIKKRVAKECESVAPFSMQVVGPVSLGKGVAFTLDSPQLLQLHKRLKEAFKPLLTPQDSQNIWPHITVQNKVSAAEAVLLLNTLKASFSPFSMQALGLQLWEYLGGPWRQLSAFPFVPNKK